MLESGQRIRLPHSLISQDFIKKMVSDLHGLCDSIAKHGLVDYQYGVAEDDITTSKPLQSFFTSPEANPIVQSLKSVLISKNHLKGLVKASDSVTQLQDEPRLEIFPTSSLLFNIV
jgi:hypothetical protein